MMKISPRLEHVDPVDTVSAEAHAAARALSVQRMSKFLDGLPREFADPSAPPLTQKQVNALVNVLRR